MSIPQHLSGAHPVVVDTTLSKYARLKPVALNAVTLNDNFWQPRQQINQQVMLPAQYRLCKDTGRIDNFRRAAGITGGEFQGLFFNDSDVYKWLEAAAWSLANLPNADLETLIDEVIEVIAAAQQPDGYLNTYFMFERAKDRWTDFSLHEMYCAGHLFQAAIACYRTTGKSKLLEVSLRLADHLYDRFGPEETGKQFGACGHPEVEMALVELYRVTGEAKYLELAQYFIGARGSKRITLAPVFGADFAYHQDHVPFRELSRMEGHAVRAVYLNCGGADVLAETGEERLQAALDRMWQNMTTRQMYLSGGLGPRYNNEGFGRDYELRNVRAHSETCAAVANVMWNWRMLALTGQARYADVMEQALYNGTLAGVSLDGRGYFYQNPLSDDGGHRREEWFTCACCPGNVSRLLASLAGYLYSTSTEGIWVHLFAASQATLQLPGGQTVSFSQKTGYPWSGEISLETETAGHFTFFVRRPGWCTQGWSVTINGQVIEPVLSETGYLQIERHWQVGDQVHLSWPMPVRFIECNPNVTENQGRVALMRGPLLYCVESADHPGLDVRRLVLPENPDFKAEFWPDLLQGVVVLQGPAYLPAAESTWGDQLYRVKPAAEAAPSQPVEITAIPYYAWANREAGPMQVWLRSDGN